MTAYKQLCAGEYCLNNPCCEDGLYNKPALLPRELMILEICEAIEERESR